MNFSFTGRIVILTAIIALFSLSGAIANEIVIETGPKQQIEATLTFASSPLKSMTRIPFKLRLAKNESKNQNIHTAVCDLTMPAMVMPPNQPELQCSGNSCSGTAIFTMAGTWQATFGLIMQDGTHASIIFDIKKVQMK